MSRPQNDSPYLYGLHDPGGENVMADQGSPGWILFTEELGCDPGDQRGSDYSRWADRDFGIIVRLNNGYEPNGTVPFSNRYAEFAARCANFVRNSRGCHIWIIGNEMNFAVERPGVQHEYGQHPPKLVRPGEIVQPGMYANCYRQCRTAIKGVAGHENDQVIVGAVAPWNPQTTYAGNAHGDWVQYLEDILTILGPTHCDGVAVHAYTHGADPKLVYTDAFMNPPFQCRQYNFRTYQDFLQAVPPSMRHLPVYLTETDQDDAWCNENTGWVQRVYGEIDWWNRQAGNQVIRAVILYRWPNVDKWGIDGKTGVIDDFRQAMSHKYSWEAALEARRRPTPPDEPVKPKPPEQPLTEPGRPVSDTSPIKFAPTGKTARGLFAAFHRQHGLELTGYPITDEYIHSGSGLKTQDWQRVSMEEWEGAIRLRLAGQEAVDLRARIAQLERQIAQLQSGVGGPVEPPITDITAQLPRDAARFVKRPLADIQYLVINHSGVRPEVGADRVAQAQRARWPGIIGQYFITGAGAIQQINPVDEVVTRDQTWIYNGINIYVAGNFDETVPGAAQMDALAHLCAWLLNKYGLGESALRGVSEFIVTRSPGLQWQQEQRWKDKLLENVRAVRGPASRVLEPVDDNQLAALQAQVNLLRALVADLQASPAASAVERVSRTAQLESGAEPPLAATTSAGAPAVQPPAITDVVDKLPRHATMKYDTRPLSQITHIAIHHSAAPANVEPERIAAYHVGKDWPGMGYHFYVRPDGTIFQTNRLETISHQVYKQNDYSIGICVAGNFMGGLIPTPKQIEALGHLVAWLTQKLDVKLENVKGHKEFPGNQTSCPGSDWLDGKCWKDLVLAHVRARLTGQALPTAKGIGHYVLFWQRADTWAREDWEAATGYFARFRPTAGFLPDDAKNAEYVTIVGGVAGVSYETEQMLVAAGCKVERLAGVDFADTKRMLDDLAAAGRRFRTLSP